MGSSESKPVRDLHKEEIKAAVKAAEEKATAEAEARRNEWREDKEALQRALDGTKTALRTAQRRATAETEARRNDWRELHNLRAQQETDARERHERATEKQHKEIVDLHKETNDRIVALQKTHNEMVAKDLALIQNLPRMIAADNESRQLIPSAVSIRQFISEIRAIHNNLCQMMADGVEVMTVKNAVKLMGQLSEKVRTEITVLITRLSYSENIESALRNKTKVALDQLQNVSNALFKKLIHIQTKEAPIDDADFAEVDGHITKMEEIFAGMPTIQGPTYAEIVNQRFRAVGDVAESDCPSETTAEIAAGHEEDE